MSTTSDFITYAILTGISGAGTYYVNKRLLKLRERKDEIATAGQFHTPTSLIENKAQYTDKAHFVAINGACLKYQNPSSHSQIEDKKHPIKDMHRSKSLYTVNYEVLLDSMRSKSWSFNQVKKEQFQIVDPIHPENSILVIPGKDALATNLHQKRKFLKTVFDL